MIVKHNVISNGFTYAHFLWKRSAKFFDTVTCQGIDGVDSQNVSHNLQVPPEMVITKMSHYNSSYGGDKWYVYHKNLGTDTGGSSDNYNSVLGLNESGSQISGSGNGIFGSAPTATNLPFDNPGYDSLAVTGNSNAKYVAYLFASLEGVSGWLLYWTIIWFLCSRYFRIHTKFILITIDRRYYI